MSYPPQGGGMPPQGGGGGPLGNAPQGPYAGGSYLPPPEQTPGYGYGAPPPAKRSAIPKVIGILMIIFASLGLLGTLINLGGGTTMPHGGSHRFNDAFDTLKSFQMITGVIGLFIGVIHLVGGIQCVRYARNAPMLAKVYGVFAIVAIVVEMSLMYAWLMPMFDGAPAGFKSFFGFLMLFGAIIGCAWPTIVLALMTRPSAKEACVN